MDDPSFGEILSDLGSAFLTLPLIATLSQIAIAKAFCKFKPTNAYKGLLMSAS